MRSNLNDVLMLTRINEMVEDGYLMREGGPGPSSHFSITNKGLAVMMAGCDRPSPKPRKEKEVYETARKAKR